MLSFFPFRFYCYYELDLPILTPEISDVILIAFWLLTEWVVESKLQQEEFYEGVNFML